MPAFYFLSLCMHVFPQTRFVETPSEQFEPSAIKTRMSAPISRHSEFSCSQKPIPISVRFHIHTHNLFLSSTSSSLRFPALHIVVSDYCCCYLSHTWDKSTWISPRCISFNAISLYCNEYKIVEKVKTLSFLLCFFYSLKNIREKHLHANFPFDIFLWMTVARYKQTSQNTQS